MAWIALSTNIITDEWLNSLQQDERYAWIVFIAYLGSCRPKWKLAKTSNRIMARLLGISEQSFANMLTSAMQNSKVLVNNCDEWEIVNGPKYDKDPTSKERQASYREQKQMRYSDMRDVTPTVHNNTIQDSIRESPPTPHAADDIVYQIVSIYNSQKPTDWYLCNAPSVFLREQIAKLPPDVDFSAIIQAARASPFLSSRKFSLEWLFKNNPSGGLPRWQEVIDGKFTDKQPKRKKAGNLRDTDIEF